MQSQRKGRKRRPNSGREVEEHKEEEEVEDEEGGGEMVEGVR